VFVLHSRIVSAEVLRSLPAGRAQLAAARGYYNGATGSCTRFNFGGQVILLPRRLELEQVLAFALGDLVRPQCPGAARRLLAVETPAGYYSYSEQIAQPGGDPALLGLGRSSESSSREGFPRWDVRTVVLSPNFAIVTAADFAEITRAWRSSADIGRAPAPTLAKRAKQRHLPDRRAAGARILHAREYRERRRPQARRCELCHGLRFAAHPQSERDHKKAPMGKQVFA